MKGDADVTGEEGEQQRGGRRRERIFD